nr:hypothetical protein [Sunxiuqinia sp.]
MKRIGVTTLVVFCMTLVGLAQTTDEFKPGGRPTMRIFSNYHSTFSDGETASAFELTRVYLGYQHQFSKELFGAAVLDVGNPGVGSLQMTAYVKNAFLRYRKNGLDVNFGLIATNQFKIQEDNWGYRYHEKSLQDEFGFNSSADLGVSVAYQFSEVISADVIVANGEGYKKLQNDSVFRTGFGVTLNPVKKLTGRVYYDFSSKEHTQSSLATFIGYEADQFRLGAEYNKQFNWRFQEDQDWSGVSFYATYHLAKKVKLFARYDKLYSNTLVGETEAWNLSNDGQVFIAGLEFAPVKGVKLAPRYKGWSPDDAGQPISSSLYLNCEIRF